MFFSALVFGVTSSFLAFIGNQVHTRISQDQNFEEKQQNKLNNPEKSIRLSGIISLGEMKSHLNKTVLLLIERFQKAPEINIRLEAAKVAARVNPTNKLVYSSIVQALANDDWAIRGFAFQFLKQTGQNVMPELIVAIKDRNSTLRVCSKSLWGRFPTGRASCFSAARPVENRPAQLLEQTLRAHAALCISYIGSNSPEVALLLGKSLNDGDEAVRTNSAAALWKMGVFAEPALPMLIDSFVKNPETRGNVSGNSLNWKKSNPAFANHNNQ